MASLPLKMHNIPTALEMYCAALVSINMVTKVYKRCL